MPHFHFVTNWTFDSPIDPVWKIITDIQRLPEWWPEFTQAALRGTDRTLRTGQVVDCVLRAPMGYRLRFTLEITELKVPVLMHLKSTGDLEGWGQWDLRPEGDRTAVSYTWDVGMNKPVLGTLSGLAPVRAILSRNHAIVMDRGFENLRRLLRAEGPGPGAP
jgi:uncharacterized protein YndB with AHSA1/START domain